ncbi:beta-glucanase (GH16 family) [Paenibacillus rhizosphaerae]|uniref:Beta-glucanase (GH16 family) n=1 Tax=Paenibacillus rhizosphaerae TaxID=297318 RepID=A0A839TFZ3_9BACL|nr:family 16 glycosylhydrolase [Paenibacillus rhizosphaerae]MBB3125474.1 beta-glucanase (GH16 family) [Paenibacillus rhizosphaerae]
MLKRIRIYVVIMAMMTMLCIQNTSVKAEANEAEANWSLVFQDDFNGTSVDTTNWRMYDGPGHVGNGLRKPSAFSVANGILTVTAQMIDGNLVSGGMAHKANYKYGKFEFRVRTDPDQSAATSAVVLTWPESENWPTDGENDIYETHPNVTRSQLGSYVHYGLNGVDKTVSHMRDIDATQWHTVAMEWEPDEIRIYIDGVLDWVTTDTGAIPDVAHHLTIQLDAFKKVMFGSTKMYVDWVKIYQKTQFPDNPTFRVIDDADVNTISYTGTWNHQSDFWFEKRTKSVTDMSGASAEMTFNGPGIAVYTKKMNLGGIFEVFIDGQSEGLVDTYNRSDLYIERVFEKTGLADGEHTIKLVATGDKNSSSTGAYIGFDFFEILYGSPTDNTAPVATAVIKPELPDGKQGWYTQPVEVRLNTINDSSGSAEMLYSFDNGTTWLPYNEPIMIDKDGRFTIQYRAKGKEGNMGEAKTLNVDLDATAPTIAISGINDGDMLNDAGDVTPIITANDGLSGMDGSKTTVTLDTSSLESGTKVPLYKLRLGPHSLTVTASDQAGNKSIRTIRFETSTSMEAIDRLVQRFAEMKLIDSDGIIKDLRSQLASGELAEFANQVKAQSDKHISSEAAGCLLRDAEYLLGGQV